MTDTHRTPAADDRVRVRGALAQYRVHHIQGEWAWMEANNDTGWVTCKISHLDLVEPKDGCAK